MVVAQNRAHVHVMVESLNHVIQINGLGYPLWIFQSTNRVLLADIIRFFIYLFDLALTFLHE